MRIGVPKEIHAGEQRVATTPETLLRMLAKLGFEVVVEAGAGLAASFEDDAYRDAGVTVIDDDTATLWSSSDIILKVRAPEKSADTGQDEFDLLRAGQTLICFFLASSKSRLSGSSSESRRHHPGGRQYSAYLPCTENGRIEFHGKYRRVPGRRRGGAALRALFHRSNYGRRKDSAGEGARHRCRGSRAVGDRRSQKYGSDRACIRYAPRG